MVVPEWVLHAGVIAALIAAAALILSGALF
jgi:hypothetical protein